MTIETEPNFAGIIQVFKRWQHIPTDELENHNQQILTELRLVCGAGVDITTELVLLSNAGCQISRTVLDALTRTSEHVARDNKFKSAVLARDGECCRVSGLIAYVEAAHIMDFALCKSDTERYDINNGLCLDVKIHCLWDSGRIVAIPDLDTHSVRFEIAEWLANPLIRAELMLIPKLANPQPISVSEPMLDYFTRRFELDCARFPRLQMH
jgi:hypothetical protein